MFLLPFLSFALPFFSILSSRGVFGQGFTFLYSLMFMSVYLSSLFSSVQKNRVVNSLFFFFFFFGKGGGGRRE